MQGKELDLKILKGITITLFIALITVTSLQIVFRYILKMSLRGSLELAQFLYISITFIGAPIIQKKREHISIDFVKDKLPCKARMILDIIIQLMSGIFLLMPIYGGILMFQLTTKSYLPTLPITFSYFYGVLIIGLSIMFIYLIRQLYFDVRSFPLRLRAAEDESKRGYN